MNEHSSSHSMTPGTWQRIGISAVLLMGLWLMLSGIYDGFHLGLGVVSVLLVLVLNRQVFRGEPAAAASAVFPHWGRIVLYVPWLVKEMVLSGIHVARVVLSPRMPLNPCLIRFKSEQPSDTARVVLGNSITLTPGTLTIDVGSSEFLVHALTRSTAAGLLNESMQRRVARLFVDVPGKMVYDTRIVQSRSESSLKRPAPG